MNEGLKNIKHPAVVLLGKSVASREASYPKYLDRLLLQTQGFHF